MRLTGSFHTIVTHGVASRVMSSVSGVVVGSTWTGLAVDTGSMLAHRTRPYADLVTSTALLTDHYELTMLQAALGSGTAHRRSVFELFPRRLPEGRRYGV